MFFRSKTAAVAPQQQAAAKGQQAQPDADQAFGMPGVAGAEARQPSLTERMAAAQHMPDQGATAAAGAAAAAPAQLPPEELRKRAAFSKQLIAAFGEIVSVVMRSEGWRQRPIADLEALILPPLISGQFTVAEAMSKSHGAVAPVAVVLWARVSTEVDRRLSAALDAPICLSPPEWTSGDQIWIIEAIGEPAILRPMLQRLAQKEWTGKAVKLRAKGQDGKLHVGVLGAAKKDEEA